MKKIILSIFALLLFAPFLSVSAQQTGSTATYDGEIKIPAKYIIPYGPNLKVILEGETKESDVIILHGSYDNWKGKVIVYGVFTYDVNHPEIEPYYHAKTGKKLSGSVTISAEIKNVNGNIGWYPTEPVKAGLLTTGTNIISNGNKGDDEGYNEIIEVK